MKRDGITRIKTGNYIDWISKSGCVTRTAFTFRSLKDAMEFGDGMLARNDDRPVNGTLIQRGPKNWRVILFSCEKAVAL